MAIFPFFTSRAGTTTDAPPGLARVHALFSPELLLRLEQRVTASETRHTGDIRICIEAGLPPSYLARQADARERALMLFGKLRVWDTEYNNGVLIYLLLSEHSIEIVADRGLNHCVTPREWAGLTDRLSAALKAAQYEKGLTEAVDEVTALLVTHFPAQSGVPRVHDLPNAPVILG